jgi:hypothetical protein
MGLDLNLDFSMDSLLQGSDLEKRSNSEEENVTAADTAVFNEDSQIDSTFARCLARQRFCDY